MPSFYTFSTMFTMWLFRFLKFDFGNYFSTFFNIKSIFSGPLDGDSFRAHAPVPGCGLYRASGPVLVCPHAWVGTKWVMMSGKGPKSWSATETATAPLASDVTADQEWQRSAAKIQVLKHQSVNSRPSQLSIHGFFMLESSSGSYFHKPGIPSHLSAVCLKWFEISPCNHRNYG